MNCLVTKMKQRESLPLAVRDSLMSCFCRFLLGRDRREDRLWMRREILQMEPNPLDEFVVRNSRENYIDDKYRICRLFSLRFGVNVQFPDEDIVIDCHSPYTIYLRHKNLKFRLLLGMEGRSQTVYQLYDLRLRVSADLCPVVGTFHSLGAGQLQVCTLDAWESGKMYTIHPKRGTDYRMLVPNGYLYVYCNDECVACTSGSDPIFPYFYIPAQKENRLQISIIVAENKSKADQYYQTEVHGQWKDVIT